MNRVRWKCIVVGVVWTSALLTATSQADAHGWGWGYPVSYSYSPCYTSCWSSCCDPCCGPSWVAGWRPGPIRRLLFGRYRWYPVSWASWGCCDSCTWEPCCGDSSVISSTVVPQSAAPPSATSVTPQQMSKPTLAPPRATPPTPGPTKSIEEEMNLLPDRSPPAAPKKTSNSSTQDSRTRGESGLLSVNVPGAAKVYINGRETRALGNYREYVSYGLQEGKIYPYTVRALVLASPNESRSTAEKPRWVWITKTVYLKAGQRVGVTFTDNLDLESQLAQVEPANIR